MLNPAAAASSSTASSSAAAAAAAAAALTELQDKKTALEAELLILNGQKAALTQYVNDRQAEGDTEKAKLIKQGADSKAAAEAEVNAMKEEKRLALEARDTAIAARDAADTRKIDAETAWNAASGSLAAANKKNQDILDEIKRVVTSFPTTPGSASLDATKTTALVTKIETIFAGSSTFTAENARLVAENSKVSADFAALKLEKDKVDLLIAERDKTIAAEKAAKTAVEAAKALVDGSLAAVGKERDAVTVLLRTATDKVAILEPENTTLKADILRIGAERDAANAANVLSQRELADARRDLAAARLDLTAARRDLTAARRDLTAARRDLAAARQQIRDQRAAIRRLHAAGAMLTNVDSIVRALYGTQCVPSENARQVLARANLGP